MKRVIVAASLTSSQKERDLLLALQHDLKSLAKCETLDDVNQVGWESYNFARYINMAVEEKGTPVEDAIQDNIEYLSDKIKEKKIELRDAIHYERKSEELMNSIESQLKQEGYSVSRDDENDIVVIPPEGATHKDCIEFVDKIVAMIGGKYSLTGRGGSWTAWNLRSHNNVRLKAGWTRDDNWMVELD